MAGWPPTSSEARVAEAKKACELLNARPVYAGQQNGHAIVDNAHYEDFAKKLEVEKPDAVITQWPIDNHADHRAITNLAYNAWHKSKNEICAVLLRSFGRRGHAAVLAESLRGHHRDGAAEKSSVLRARQPNSRPLLCIAR